MGMMVQLLVMPQILKQGLKVENDYAQGYFLPTEGSRWLNLKLLWGNSLYN